MKTYTLYKFLIIKLYLSIEYKSLIFHFSAKLKKIWSKTKKEAFKLYLRPLFCDSEAIRTLDPRLRRALLYPAELRNHP